ncbi:hypothetical protein [Leptospira neocaledonica]|uniref:Uncharacterized protein n=1 Tax=Leptospira neocaledonica TaxID=2023192 RepID=A0A2M9ZTH2_9LEPT|nr:hypothetical protein [Leptospira neocaledonica]PJZ75294.1 hypothetical protein CH365_19635 [Leptospira neocaledonica]
MDGIWKDLKSRGKIKTPLEIVDNLFKTLPGDVDNLVSYSIQKVNYFPEEVTYTTSSPITSIAMNSFVARKDPHPEFGYDPNASASKEHIRFRLLLFPTSNEEITIELFKVKFPILFYPLQIFCDEHTFPEMKKYFDNNKLIATNEKDFTNKILQIVSSETTFSIIQRLMSF